MKRDDKKKKCYNHRMLYPKQKSPVGIKALLIKKKRDEIYKVKLRTWKNMHTGVCVCGGGACLQTVELLPSQVCSDHEWM